MRLPHDEDELRKERRARLKKLMKKVAKPKRKKFTPTKFKATVDENSIRTRYEEIYESYCRLLGQPYVINAVWCFTCNNYWIYNSSSTNMPKKCKICGIYFYSPGIKQVAKITDDNPQLGHFCRPDFILDFNTGDMKSHYQYHTARRKLDMLEKYHDEYVAKLGIIRIDGGQHDTFHQQKKDYKQYMNFKDSGIKVFIIRNEDIDSFLDLKDNGDSLLRHCKFIGDCVLDDNKYKIYCKDKDFQERTKKPF